MKFYTYVSDAKVEMLFDQMPKGPLERIATELRIDLKVVSLSLKDRETDQNRFRRLAIVTAYIDSHLEVGSIEDPKPWFRGTARLVQARAGRDAKAVILFAGDLRSTLLGLTGSLRHVIGDVSGSIHHGSAVAGAVDAYEALRSLDRNQPTDGPSELVHALRGLVERTASDFAGTEQPCEFLARTLVHLPSRSRRKKAFLLGTPLYVAAADSR
jgi:hypothetical protein